MSYRCGTCGTWIDNSDCPKCSSKTKESPSADVLMSTVNFPRYEMGRCASCGDCNRESPYVDELGEWTKFKEVVLIYSNSLHQIKAQIDALIEEFCELYDGDLSNEAVSLLLTELRKLSAGLAVCEFKTKV